MFAFAQEHRAERAAERLSDLLPRRATVVRDGTRRDDRRRGARARRPRVAGAGDRISADLECVEAHALARRHVDAHGRERSRRPDVGRPRCTRARSSSRARASAVVDGNGGRHPARGDRRTHRGRASGPRQPARASSSTVSSRVDGRRSRSASVSRSSACARARRASPASDGFLFAIGVTVASCPEGCCRRSRSRSPSARSAWPGGTRSSAAWRRSRRSARPRSSAPTRPARSPATRWRWCEVWTPAGTAAIAGVRLRARRLESTAIRRRREAAPVELALAAVRCSTGRAVQRGRRRWVARGDPMEAALDVLARRLGIDADARRHRRPDDAALPVRPAPATHVGRRRRRVSREGRAGRRPATLRDRRRARRAPLDATGRRAGCGCSPWRTASGTRTTTRRSSRRRRARPRAARARRARGPATAAAPPDAIAAAAAPASASRW